MELLQDSKNRGYPTDYLVARIHGRRVYLFSDWDVLLFSRDIKGHLMPTRYGAFMDMHSAEGIQLCYRRELHWIYHQMNSRLRNIFKPYFINSELGTLMTGLRFKLDNADRADIELLLSYSLLSDHIIEALRAESDISSSLKLIEKSLVLPSGIAPDLQGTYEKEGLQQAENGLKRALFAYIFSLHMHPVMRSFFTALADTVNLLALYKHLKWETSAEPAFIDGSSIPEERFRRISASRNSDELVQLIYKQTGLSLEEWDEPRLEPMFNRYITGQIKRRGRETSDIGFILNYLWRCSIEARNLTVISYGTEIDRALIKRELVY